MAIDSICKQVYSYSVWNKYWMNGTNMDMVVFILAIDSSGMSLQLSIFVGFLKWGHSQIIKFIHLKSFKSDFSRIKPTILWGPRNMEPPTIYIPRCPPAHLYADASKEWWEWPAGTARRSWQKFAESTDVDSPKFRLMGNLTHASIQSYGRLMRIQNWGFWWWSMANLWHTYGSYGSQSYVFGGFLKWG